MSAYVIVDIVVNDPERYEQYKQLARPTVEKYGGRYVARGGKAENLEGDWEPRRLVVLEFPTYGRAKAWWDSPEYADAKALRHEIAESRMVVVEGV